MKDGFVKFLIGLLLVFSLVLTAVYVGNSKITPSSPLMSSSSREDQPPPPPDLWTAERDYSAYYIRGYQDGYSGAWLAPGKWLLVDEYRVGHYAGRNDRANGKPNRFNK